MPKKNETLHSKPLGDNRFRELSVAYDKGGMNYFDYKVKPKGIYLRSSVLEKTNGMIRWQMGQPTDGYLCIVELERYRPSVLKAVSERVKTYGHIVHYLLEGGHVDMTRKLLAGEATKSQALRVLADDLVEEVKAKLGAAA